MRTAFDWADNASLRAEIARIVPAYSGIEHLSTRQATRSNGAGVTCAAEADSQPRTGAGSASVIDVPARHDVPDGSFVVSTRRGKQFNSIIWAEIDPLTGAGRDGIYMVAATRPGSGSTTAPPFDSDPPTGTSTGISWWSTSPTGPCRCIGPRATR